ncbi:hypothetical protein Poli38472_009926 [Pythium oligandrum]|uniref:Uncharacterized protein n=1 Tax=Pythium oligandrum TaxID=41045 RepID=A0A8K1FG59_PYTOL|nr:hypothetical protein Poli38472_009926 [Pythium oligandrum]|eukprot:TMW58367.1 hypothetical protein Poli38472_009926 [Pythium oligandrum]
MRLSRLKPPTQRSALLLQSTGGSSPLKLPSLVKPSGPSAALSEATRRPGNGNQDDDDRDDEDQASEKSRTASGRSKGAVDKHRDFIKELEEQKKKQKEEQAKQEARRKKLQKKLTQKILNEAAERKEQNEEDGAEEEQGMGDGGSEAAPEAVDEQDEETQTEQEELKRKKKKEKARRAKRLLQKQQALLEQMQVKKKEKIEEEEQEKERERRRQERLKKAVLESIYAKTEEVPEQEVEEEQVETARSTTASPVESSEWEQAESPQKTSPRLSESSSLTRVASVDAGGPSPDLTKISAAGKAITAVRQRKEKKEPLVEEPSAEDKVRSKEQREAVHKKQHEYLQRLAEQRRQKQKEEDDARLLQEKRRKRVQKEAQQRLQEAAAKLQQQRKEEEEAREAEEEDVDKKRTTTVDVDAMIARLSKLKDKDAQVIPEARDFASWRKRYGVRSDQKVFCMTGWYPVIREELEKRGWFFNQERNSPFFDLKWSLKSDDLKGIKLEKHQYVNHFFQNTAITTKVGLLHNLRNLSWHQSVDIDTVFPRAYDLNEPRDMDDFVMDFRYSFAEGVLKEVAKRLLHHQTQKSSSSIRLNEAFIDVLRSVARKKLRYKRVLGSHDEGEDDLGFVDALEESVDEMVTAGMDDLVTELEWEVLTRCQLDAPGAFRASLAYKKRTVVDDKTDLDGAGPPMSNGVDTVQSALEKKQQRQLEKMRMDAFQREKTRLGSLLSRVTPLSKQTTDELVQLTSTLAKVCPQFHLNGGGDLQSTDPENKSRNVWIVKPAGMSRGRGIRVFNNLEALLEYADVENHKECQWVAQKYIENPLLICKRKFDIRQWVLVTDWDPLTVWFYDDCYLRFSSEEYSMDDLGDQYVHLTNNSIQKYSDKFNDVYTTEDGAMHVEGNMWHSDDFQQYIRDTLGRGDVFNRDMQPRMKQIVVQSLQCVQDMVQHRKNCCELYGYDFMVDETLRPWLIEVNSSPACDYSTPTAKRYVETGLAGIVKVIVDHREFEQKKKAGHNVDEPDTGRWRRVHRAEYIGKPVSSFGADFQVKGVKVGRSRSKAVREKKRQEEEDKVPVVETEDMEDEQDALEPDGDLASVTEAPQEPHEVTHTHAATMEEEEEEEEHARGDTSVDSLL